MKIETKFRNVLNEFFNKDENTENLVVEYNKAPVIQDTILSFNETDLEFRKNYVMKYMENMHMRNETKFRSNFVAKCNESGLYTLALETTIPGYPDVQVAHDNKLLLIETKCISEDEMDSKAMSKFKPTQPVFYKEYLHDSENDNLYCLVKVGKNKFIAFKITEGFVHVINSVRFNTIKDYASHYFECDNLLKCIEWFKTFLE